MKPQNLKGPLLLAAFVAVSFGVAGGAFAQIETVKIQVDGLGCPFCVKGIEKHLKKVEGVDRLSTNLKKGEVTLQYAPGALFDIRGLQKAVKRGGFTARAVEVTARGKIVQEENGFVFNIIGTKTAFLIHEPDSTDREEMNTAVSGETKTRLQKAVDANHTLEITGEVHNHKDALPGLSIEKLSKVNSEDHARG